MRVARWHDLSAHRALLLLVTGIRGLSAACDRSLSCLRPEHSHSRHDFQHGRSSPPLRTGQDVRRHGRSEFHCVRSRRRAVRHGGSQGAPEDYLCVTHAFAAGQSGEGAEALAVSTEDHNPRIQTAAVRASRRQQAGGSWTDARVSVAHQGQNVPILRAFAESVLNIRSAPLL